MCQKTNADMIPQLQSGGHVMKRFIEGQERDQATLFPECLEDWVDEDNPVRVIDAFVDSLDLGALGFAGVDPKATGWPVYHPMRCNQAVGWSVRPAALLN